MASALKRSVEEFGHNHIRFFRADEASRHDKDIGIVVLACQMSNFGSPAKSRTNALMLVERHVDAVSAAADSNSRVTFACLDSLRQLMGKVGIVAAFGRVGSVIFVRPAFGFQPTADILFQFKAGVVGTKSKSFQNI